MHPGTAYPQARIKSASNPIDTPFHPWQETVS
jgi:hypothetical protein